MVAGKYILKYFGCWKRYFQLFWFWQPGQKYTKSCSLFSHILSFVIVIVHYFDNDEDELDEDVVDGGQEDVDSGDED